MTEYLPFNKPLDLWFILIQYSHGGNEYGKPGHMSIFHFFEALNDAFEVEIFQGFMFTPIYDMQLRFF